MNDRLQTDFLFASSSFLGGFGSVLGVGGSLPGCNASEDPDGIALANDWLMVGQDIRDVMEKTPKTEGALVRDER